MTTVPQSLAELGTYWVRQGGVNLGVIGNQKHCRGYHLGRDRIYSACACRPDGTCEPGMYAKDYSVQTARDKAGLTNAASAIDLGRLNGSLDALYDFSDWLARRCLRGVAGTNDVREVIYSPDGNRVLGFKDGIEFLIPNYGDRSHLTHTHISFYRDSENRDKRPLFTPYFELPDTGGEVHTVVTTLPFGGRYTIPAGASVTGFQFNPATGDFGESKTWEPRPSASSASYDATMVTDATRGDPFLRCIDGFFAGFWIAAAAVDEKPNPAPAADCTDAVAAQRERDRTAHLANIEEVYSA